MLVSSMSLEFLSLGTVDIGAVWGGHGPCVVGRLAVSLDLYPLDASSALQPQL